MSFCSKKTGDAGLVGGVGSGQEQMWWHIPLAAERARDREKGVDMLHGDRYSVWIFWKESVEHWKVTVG